MIHLNLVSELKRHIMNIKKLLAKIVLLILVLFSICNAQTKGKRITLNPNDRQVGNYNLPYEVPATDSIIASLNRMYNCLLPGTTFTVYDRETHKPITDFSEPNKNADLNSGDRNAVNYSFSYWSYPTGVLYSSLAKATEATGNKKYHEFGEKAIQFYLYNIPYFKKIDSQFGEINNSYKSLLHTSSLDDCGSMGAALIRYYKINNDPRLREIIYHIADYISNKQFRLKDKTLARQRPQAQSVWADDAYMCIPFLAEMGSLTGERKYFDDAARQAIQLSKYLFRWDKKLFDHGVNIHNLEYDPNFYWGRANGWVITAIVDLLDLLPENHKDRKMILKILRTHVQGLAECQGADGFWHNLLDKTDSYTETSCTALFTYSIAHAINKGWIDYTYGPVAQAGWNAIATKILPTGQVEGTCTGTTFASDAVYYYHRPTDASHSFGPVILAGTEVIKLFENDNFVIRPANGTYHYRLKSDLK